jgi:hypothetical protein
MPASNPITSLLAAVHDAYLQQREAQAVKRLRACRARLPDLPRPRKARRIAPDLIAPPAAPAPIAPPAVSPSPTFETTARPAYPGIAKTGYSALVVLLEAIDAAAADASQDGARMVIFQIGRTKYAIRQAFKNLERFKKLIIRNRTAFSDKAIA